MTSATATIVERPAKPAHRPYRVRVAAVRRLAPSFVRITFTGDDLGDFGVDGLDQRIKVVLPLEATGYDTFPTDDWYASWRALPAEQQNAFRTYTARAARPAMREVDVDFVCHGDTGPASAWAGRARVGDELMLVGPDATSGVTGSGVEWSPGDARTLLLAGDETAAPAICAILEALDVTAVGHVFIEVPTDADRLPVSAPAGVEVRWIARNGASHGVRMTDQVHAWASTVASAGVSGAAGSASSCGDAVELTEVDVDEQVLWDVPAASDDRPVYAWIAGEAGCVKELRRHLVRGVGLDREQVAFMGYWRHGKAEN